MVVALKAFPKINIGLYVGQISNSLHNLVSIFQKIDTVYDLVTVFFSQGKKREIKVSGLEKYVSLKNSTCYKAALLYLDQANINGFADICVYKNIPVKSGLGGGSSDGAAVLKALQMIMKEICPSAYLTDEKLFSIAFSIGSDVPFFLSAASTALVSSCGEKIQMIKSREDLKVSLIENSAESFQKISTAQAFQKLDELGVRKNLPQEDELLNMYYSPVCSWKFENDFEKLYSKPIVKLNENQKLYLTGAGNMWYKVSEF